MQSKRLLAAALSLAVLGLALVAIGLSSFHKRTALLQASLAPHAATLQVQQLRVKSARNGARTQMLFFGGFKDLINSVKAKHEENVNKFKAAVQAVHNSVQQQGIKGTFLDIFDDGKLNNLNNERSTTSTTSIGSNDPDAPSPRDIPSIEEPADDPGHSVSVREDEIDVMDEIDVTDGAGDVSRDSYPDENDNVWAGDDAMFDNAEVTPASWRHANIDHGVSSGEYAQWFQGHT